MYLDYTFKLKDKIVTYTLLERLLEDFDQNFNVSSEDYEVKHLECFGNHMETALDIKWHTGESEDEKTKKEWTKAIYGDENVCFVKAFDKGNNNALTGLGVFLESSHIAIVKREDKVLAFIGSWKKDYLNQPHLEAFAKLIDKYFEPAEGFHYESVISKDLELSQRSLNLIDLLSGYYTQLKIGLNKLTMHEPGIDYNALHNYPEIHELGQTLVERYENVIQNDYYPGNTLFNDLTEIVSEVNHIKKDQNYFEWCVENAKDKPIKPGVNNPIYWVEGAKSVVYRRLSQQFYNVGLYLYQINGLKFDD